MQHEGFTLRRRLKAAIGREISREEFDDWHAATIAKGRLNKASSERSRANASQLEARLRDGLLSKLPVEERVATVTAATLEVAEEVNERVKESAGMIGYPNRGPGKGTDEGSTSLGIFILKL